MCIKNFTIMEFLSCHLLSCAKENYFIKFSLQYLLTVTYISPFLPLIKSLYLNKNGCSSLKDDY